MRRATTLLRLPQRTRRRCSMPARPSGATRAAIEWGPEPYRTRFQACWDPRALHVRFDAVDDSALAHDDAGATTTSGKRRSSRSSSTPTARAATTRSSRSARPTSSATFASTTPWPSLKSLTEWDWDGLTLRRRAVEDAHGTAEGWTALARLPWTGLRSLYPGGLGGPAAEGRRGLAVQRLPHQAAGRARPAADRRRCLPPGRSRPVPSFHDPAAFRPMTFL